MRFLAWRTVVTRGTLIAAEPLILAGRPLVAPEPLVLSRWPPVLVESLILPWGAFVFSEPLVFPRPLVASESLGLTWRMTIAPWRPVALTGRTTVMPRRAAVVTWWTTAFPLASVPWPLAFLPPLELLFAPAHIPRFLRVLERLARVAMTSAGPPCRASTRPIRAPLAAFLSSALRVFLRLPEPPAREVFQHRIRMFLQDAFERRQ
jgi:hypothetical protein